MDIAGIVLGAVGLAGPSHDLYKRCSQLVSEISKGESNFNLYSDKITIQKGLHTDIWRAALSLVKVDKDIATIMLEDEDHPVWTDPDFLKLITVTLGEHFTAGMKVTKITLKEIESVLSKAKSEKEENISESSSFKKSKTTADKGLRILTWGFKGKKDLLRLLKRLREENMDLYHICRQREEAKRASGTATEEGEDSAYRDPVLARLFAIRDMSKILYDSLKSMSSCSCHHVYLQLGHGAAGSDALGARSGAEFVLPIWSGSRHQPAIVGRIGFPLVIASMGERDWDIHIIIESKLVIKEANRSFVSLTIKRSLLHLLGRLLQCLRA
ncbi:hypothetical protein B9Z19DRAFT_211745 [Tuber borchii]|uniref:Uncharacterized protein n=1 Tax=Tuber borchii TaxID=42251 RepID=A0A2T7A5V3_TUBBO|nr:hypothetical protein B9Z19DRAFT_211745 [Tuber borchii]